MSVSAGLGEADAVEKTDTARNSGGLVRGSQAEEGVEARSERNRLLCEALIDIAAVLFSVSGDDLRREGRTTRRIARVRQIAMYSAHTVLGLSQKEVGRAFRRDRTTVVHACHTIEDLREDDEFDRAVQRFDAVVLAGLRLRLEGPAR